MRLECAVLDQIRFSVRCNAPQTHGYRSVKHPRRGRVAQELKARLRSLIDNLPTIKQPSSNTLVHGDLHGSQILVTKDTHQLAGVIDWGDVHLGDPASDFAVVHSMLPRDCHRDFLQAYGPVDPVLWAAAKARAIWHTMAVVSHALDVGDKATIMEAQLCLIRLAED